MIVSTLMAASLALAPVQQEVPAPIQKQAQIITVMLISCRPVIDPDYWDEWLPISRDLGITQEFISNARTVVARDPYPVTETLCLTSLASATEKLKNMLESDTDDQ